MGLALTNSNWDGDDDFCRGMRLLQEHLFGRESLAVGELRARVGVDVRSMVRELP